ncbi:MAG TPA: ABC transporter permease [Candidatus Sulfotelmatobacter sp.]|nr:ABC transporter permease [Candidatus Sulfotelmatobacter sp.]
MRALALRVGGRTLTILEYLGGLSQLGWQALVQGLRPPYDLFVLLRQIDLVGVKSLGIVGIAAVFTGLVLALQTAYALARFGAKAVSGMIVGLAMTRELGPVLTALLVGGRVGSGITAELGSMQVTEQLDAMRVMGTSPIKRLVVPRVIATMFALPILTLIADVVGILGGMLIMRYEFGVEYQQYYNSMITYLKLSDLFSGLGKTVFFGLIIGLVGCYEGLKVTGGTEGLGRATTATVVISSVLVLVSTFFLTKFFWWLETW